jgi:hypothetical protein
VRINSGVTLSESSGVCKGGKVSYPCTRLWRPIGMWDIEAPTFSLDNRLTDGGEVVSLTRRPSFTSRKIPGSHFSQRLSRPEGHSAAERIRSIEKKNNNIIGNRPRDLSACIIVIYILFVKYLDEIDCEKSILENVDVRTQGADIYTYVLLFILAFIFGRLIRKLV